MNKGKINFYLIKIFDLCDLLWILKIKRQSNLIKLFVIGSAVALMIIIGKYTDELFIFRFSIHNITF